MKTIITLFLSAMGAMSFAQQLDLTTQYRYNWQVLNPAASNYSKMDNQYMKSVVNFSANTQRITEDWAIDPLTLTFRYENYPEINNGVAIKWGGFVTQEQLGAIKTTKGNVNIAGILPINGENEQQLSIGLNLGAYQQIIDIAEISFASGQMPGVEPFNRIVPDVAAGIFYQYVDKDNCMTCSEFGVRRFYAGLSALQLVNFPELGVASGDLYVEPVQHLYLLAGIVVPFWGEYNSDENTIETSLWVRYIPDVNYVTLTQNGIPVSADFNVRVKYGNLLWVGTGFGSNRLAHTEVGITLKDVQNNTPLYLINIGASYSFPVGWNKLRGDVYEVSVGYAWK